MSISPPLTTLIRVTDICARVRYQVQYAKPLDFALEANKLAQIIKQYNIDSDSLFVR